MGLSLNNIYEKNKNIYEKNKKKEPDKMKYAMIHIAMK